MGIPKILLFATGSLLLVGCNPGRHQSEPFIELTKLPPYSQGSSEHFEVIEGRVSGHKSGQRVVLYARSGVWWVQPFADRPFTSIRPDSTWSTRTHPGSAYAALLVSANYSPSPRTEVLPQKGGEVLAVIIAERSGPAPLAGKSLVFAGYEWQVRETPNDSGGTKNVYDSANAWTDEKGLLHLRITGSPGRWASAEVSLGRSLGYGTYRFVVRDLSRLEPAVVFNMRTWDDNGPYREMDIEISRWGEKQNRNGQFVIQPYHLPANTVQFDTPAGTTTFALRWFSGRASFKVFRGAITNWNAPAVREHTFSSGVPPAGSESVHMNLYVFGNPKNPLQHPTEVIVEEFEYLP